MFGSCYYVQKDLLSSFWGTYAVTIFIINYKNGWALLNLLSERITRIQYYMGHGNKYCL